MGHSHLLFKRKMRSIEQKHAKLIQGSITIMRPDGLMEMKPRRRERRAIFGPLFLLALGVICFKAFTLFAIGEATYEERLASLSGGTVIEAAGAWVMQIDPATQWIVDTLENEFF